MIISGTAYRDMNGDSTYTAGVDRPIEGAVIRSAGAENFVSYSDASGHYAAYGFTAAGACRSFAVIAIHPLTMFRNTANITTCDTPYIVNNLNFKLADAQTEVPDDTAPVVDLGLKVAPGQNAGFVAGTILTGTDLQLSVDVIDQDWQRADLSVDYTPLDKTVTQHYTMRLIALDSQLHTRSRGRNRPCSSFPSSRSFPRRCRGRSPICSVPTSRGTTPSPSRRWIVPETPARRCCRSTPSPPARRPAASTGRRGSTTWFPATRWKACR